MDNRLAESSRGKVMTAVKRWTEFAASRGWSPLLLTGERDRGAKMIAWVVQMKNDTDLVYSSISTYLWGVRTWHVLQHQADPCFGVMHWREFMHGVATSTSTYEAPNGR